MSKFIVFVMLVSCAVKPMAQDAYFKNYTEKDGLSNNKIKCITQDRKGFCGLAPIMA